MSQGPSRAFFRDLVGLLRRHGPEPFADLAAALTDPEQREEVVRALRVLATTAEEARRYQRPRATQRSRRKNDLERGRSLLDALRQSDPQKAELLARFYGELRSRVVLPSRTDVLEFCSSLRLEIPSYAQRNKLVLPLLRHLAELPREELQSALDAAVRASGDPGKDYQLLAKTIMKQTSSP